MRAEQRCAWSVVIPYYNESAFIARTLDSLLAQDIPFSLILVDNASTDGSPEICRALMARHPHVETTHLMEKRPGKTHALEAGLAAVRTEYAAFCDADTFYPPQYLRRCSVIFAQDPEVHAALAVDLFDEAGLLRARLRRWAIAALLAPVFSRQAHSGGSALAFRTAPLREAGGFSARLWPFVLEDHEVIQRICRRGKLGYRPDHWCRQSDRRRERTRVTWTRFERTLYSFTPYALKDWFFYAFLAKRFHRRGLYQVNLRDRSAFAADAPIGPGQYTLPLEV